MKLKNLIAKLGIALLTVSLLFHVSCASSGGENGDEASNNDDAAVSEGMENAAGGGNGDDLTASDDSKKSDDKKKDDFSDLSDSNDKGSAEAKVDDAKAAEAKASGKDDDLNLEEFASNDKGAKDATAGGDAKPEAAGAEASKAKDDSMDDLLSPKDNPPATAKADTNTAGLTDASKEGTPPTAEPPAPPPVETPVVAVTEPKPKRHHSGPALAPKIPDHALKKSGASLNRFYFVRQNDTPAKVSTLLYGNPDRQKDLKKWNKGKWGAGKLIYYQSAQQPDEQEMRSFYQERGVQPEEYVVQAHETLFSIAQKKLGSRKSWKELAVVNGLERSNSISSGQKLAVYPADLATVGAPPPPVAQNEPPKENKPPEKPAEAPPSQANGQIPPPPDSTPPNPANPPPDAIAPPVAQENPGNAVTDPNAPPVAEAPLTSRRKKGGSLDIAKLAEQNFFTLLIIAAFLILVIALSAVNKKRRSRNAEDFPAEDFGSPKAKRK